MNKFSLLAAGTAASLMMLCGSTRMSAYSTVTVVICHQLRRRISGMNTKSTSMALLAAFLAAGQVYAAPHGELDDTFGENGRMMIHIANGAFGWAITRQPADGKLVVARSSTPTTALVGLRFRSYSG